jgi:HEAT repeat protein
MAFVRAAPEATKAAPPESRETLLEQLAGNDIDMRRRAARALSRDAGAAAALAGRLECEPELVVRHALFRSLVDIGGTPAVNLIAGLLRSGDAGLRGGAVESLKLLGEEAAPALDDLLGDPDPDVRILAVEVTRAWPSALAAPRLRRVIENDNHINVCGTAVDVATEVGTSDLLRPLAELRSRFPEEQFLIFAVDVACSRIHGCNEQDA